MDVAIGIPKGLGKERRLGNNRLFIESYSKVLTES